MHLLNHFVDAFYQYINPLMVPGIEIKLVRQE